MRKPLLVKARRDPVVSISAGAHRSKVIAKRDALIEENRGLVLQIAHRIMKRLPPSFELQDLVQAGNVALVEAALRYRPAEHKDTPFSAFARKSVEGAILNSVSRKNYEESTRVGIQTLSYRSHF